MKGRQVVAAAAATAAPNKSQRRSGMAQIHQPPHLKPQPVKPPSVLQGFSVATAT